MNIDLKISVFYNGDITEEPVKGCHTVQKSYDLDVSTGMIIINWYCNSDNKNHYIRKALLEMSRTVSSRICELEKYKERLYDAYDKLAFEEDVKIE